MLKKLYIAVFILLTIASCTDQINVDLPEGESKLIVEGWFKNDSTSQIVKLSKSTSYDEENNNSPEVGATVTIETTGGNTFSMLETEPGIYVADSNDFIVQVDSTYFLNILLADGKQYKSEKEWVNSVPPIDAVIFLSNEALDEIGFGDFFPEDSYYPAFTTVEQPGRGDNYVWKLYRNGEDLSVGNNLFYENDDNLTDGAVVPFNISFFSDSVLIGDVVKVEQMTCSATAENYFFQLSNQINGGGPFSTPPAPVEGNIKNIKDEDEFVLGIFIVTAVHSLELTVNEFNTVDEIPSVE